MPGWDGEGPLTVVNREEVRRFLHSCDGVPVPLPAPDGCWHRIPGPAEYRCNGHVLTHWRANDDGTVSFRAAGG